jgi:hypothetical protein
MNRSLVLPFWTRFNPVTAPFKGMSEIAMYSGQLFRSAICDQDVRRIRPSSVNFSLQHRQSTLLYSNFLPYPRMMTSNSRGSIDVNFILDSESRFDLREDFHIFVDRAFGSLAMCGCPETSVISLRLDLCTFVIKTCDEDMNWNACHRPVTSVRCLHYSFSSCT